MQYVAQTGIAAGISILMPAAVFSTTGAGSDECWRSYAAGNFRPRAMSGEDWAAGMIY